MPVLQRQQKRKGVSEEVALVLHAALLATWIGFLFWSSFASRLPSIPRILAWDKLQHLLAYAILMFFSGRFFKLLLKNHFKGWIIAFLFTIAFGILMEIGQETLTTARHADWKDIVANATGATLILLIALYTKEEKRQSTSP